jgi:hypothetical protein
MKALGRTKLDLHARRLLVDEAEWGDRLNQLADIRHAFTVPVAGAAIATAPNDGRGIATGRA